MAAFTLGVEVFNGRKIASVKVFIGLKIQGSEAPHGGHPTPRRTPPKRRKYENHTRHGRDPRGRTQEEARGGLGWTVTRGPAPCRFSRWWSFCGLGVVHFFLLKIIFPARQKSQKSEHNFHTLSGAVG